MKLARWVAGLVATLLFVAVPLVRTSQYPWQIPRY
jgi:hypothetical protein